MLKIARAVTADQHSQARELIAELAEWDASRVRQLGLDGQEVVRFYYSTPEDVFAGPFEPPDGCLLLATDPTRAAGCGAFHRLGDDACEMKHMYVRPEFRGMRVGRQIAEVLVATAREAGYRWMRLETTTFMDGARALYASVGFRPCDPYYAIPESFRAITVFMEIDLTRPSS